MSKPQLVVQVPQKPLPTLTVKTGVTAGIRMRR